MKLMWAKIRYTMSKLLTVLIKLEIPYPSPNFVFF